MCFLSARKHFSWQRDIVCGSPLTPHLLCLDQCSKGQLCKPAHQGNGPQTLGPKEDIASMSAHWKALWCSCLEWARARGLREDQPAIRCTAGWHSGNSLTYQPLWETAVVKNLSGSPELPQLLGDRSGGVLCFGREVYRAEGYNVSKGGILHLSPSIIAFVLIWSR